MWYARSQPESERVEDLWPAYVKDRKKYGVAVDRYPFIWKALEPHFGYRIGSAITKDDCRAYYAARKAQGKADSTARTEIALLSACLKWHYGKSAISLWLPPTSSPRIKWLTKDEVRTILAATDTPHIKLFVTLAVATGARAGAILDLTWDRVDFAHGTIDYQPAGRIKTNKHRIVVPMNQNARAALEEAHKARLSDYVIEYNGKQVGSVKKGMQRLSEKTGISFSAHVFRHTCAVWMAQDDIAMSKISQYLGHASTHITESVYARYSPSFMKDASQAATW